MAKYTKRDGLRAVEDALGGGVTLTDDQRRALTADAAFASLVDSAGVLGLDECVDVVRDARAERQAQRVGRTIERGAAGTTEHLRALAYAMSGDVYRRASGHDSDGRAERIEAFRRDALGPAFPIPVARMLAWAQTHEGDDGGERALLVPKPGGYVDLVGYEPGGVLAELHGLADELVAELEPQWDESAAVAFVLGDVIPRVQPVGVKLGPRTVTLTVHRDVTPDEVAEAYRRARARHFRDRPKSAGVNTLRAAGFAALRWDRQWPEVFAQWRRQHPGDDTYGRDWRSFRRAVLAGLDAVR